MTQFDIHDSCGFLKFWISNDLYVIFKIIQGEWKFYMLLLLTYYVVPILEQIVYIVMCIYPRYHSQP